MHHDFSGFKTLCRYLTMTQYKKGQILHHLKPIKLQQHASPLHFMKRLLITKLYPPKGYTYNQGQILHHQKPFYLQKHASPLHFMTSLLMNTICQVYKLVYRLRLIQIMYQLYKLVSRLSLQKLTIKVFQLWFSINR